MAVDELDLCLRERGLRPRGSGHLPAAALFLNGLRQEEVRVWVPSGSTPSVIPFADRDVDRVRMCPHERRLAATRRSSRPISSRPTPPNPRHAGAIQAFLSDGARGGRGSTRKV